MTHLLGVSVWWRCCWEVSVVFCKRQIKWIGWLFQVLSCFYNRKLRALVLLNGVEASNNGGHGFFLLVSALEDGALLPEARLKPWRIRRSLSADGLEGLLPFPLVVLGLAGFYGRAFWSFWIDNEELYDPWRTLPCFFQGIEVFSLYFVAFKTQPFKVAVVLTRSQRSETSNKSLSFCQIS